MANNNCEICKVNSAEGKPSAIRFRGRASVSKVCKNCKKDYGVDADKEKRSLFRKK